MKKGKPRFSVTPETVARFRFSDENRDLLPFSSPTFAHYATAFYPWFIVLGSM